MQKSYQANAPRHDKQNNEMDRQKKGLQLTGVWQNGGISAKLEKNYSI
jgi:hypothetical protein